MTRLTQHPGTQCRSLQPVLASSASALLVALSVSTLISCTSSRAPHADQFTFATRITDAGLKQFEVSFPYTPRRLVLEERASSGAQRREETERLTDRKIEEIVAAKVSAAGFCRQGYILLGSQAGITVQKIRGECREVASPEDRASFPDTIDRW